MIFYLIQKKFIFNFMKLFNKSNHQDLYNNFVKFTYSFLCLSLDIYDNKILCLLKYLNED
jgi:hypothetical protein